jgi:hypothetical protein
MENFYFILNWFWKLEILAGLMWFLYLWNGSIYVCLLGVIRGIISCLCLLQTLGTDAHFQNVNNGAATIWAIWSISFPTRCCYNTIVYVHISWLFSSVFIRHLQQYKGNGTDSPLWLHYLDAFEKRIKQSIISSSLLEWVRYNQAQTIIQQLVACRTPYMGLAGSDYRLIASSVSNLLFDLSPGFLQHVWISFYYLTHQIDVSRFLVASRRNSGAENISGMSRLSVLKVVRVHVGLLYWK